MNRIPAMRAVSSKWVIQVDVTNACPRRCSNCTRLTAHVKRPFFTTPLQFRRALEAVATFPADSTPDPEGRRKVIGMIGGEPTIHPQFERLCAIFREVIPERKHRGLWTSMGPAYEKHRVIIEDTFGYLHRHPHEPPARHQPVLIASREAIPDERRRLEYIWGCWLGQSWGASITPKGLYFCEVAGALDMVLGGPGGLPVEPYCWQRSMLDFHDQVKHWCHRCGVCVPLPGRLDCDKIDDVSPRNFAALKAAHSPGLARCRVFDCASYSPGTFDGDWNPRRYRDHESEVLMPPGVRP
jgi:hypothetical protein